MAISFKDYSPQTFHEAVDILIANLDTDALEYIKNNESSSIHHSFGMAMRNEWGLWHNSDLALYFKEELGIGHADDMSGLILEALFAYVQQRDFVLEEEVEVYKKFWLEQGIDPKTQLDIA